MYFSSDKKWIDDSRKYMTMLINHADFNMPIPRLVGSRCAPYPFIIESSVLGTPHRVSM